MRSLLAALLFCCTLFAPVHADERRFSSAELQDFVGQYTLSDGRVLSVTQRHHLLMAQIGDGAPVELVPVGPARFSDRASTLQLTFDQRQNGNVAAVTLGESASVPTGHAKK